MIEIPVKKTSTNPNLLVIQSKLFSPSYSGTGKWVVYNTDTNKGVLAVGKDKIPPVIPLLTELSSNKKVELNDDIRKKLDKVGFLNETFKNDIVFSPNSFLKLYHNATFDYSFRNYSDKDWLEKDHSTMDYYQKLWEHPSIFTERYGEKIYLPDYSDDQIKNINNNEISLPIISYLLKSSLGSLGMIKSHPVNSYRRTSPSGGAKHPTEASVYINKPIGDLEEGLYIYDVKHHALIRDESKDDLFELNSYEDSVSIILHSRVERPMWRYREIRSYRAILIDAGHVIEVMNEVAGNNGLYTKMEHISFPNKINGNFDWLVEPPICVLHISKLESPKILEKTKSVEIEKIKDSDKYKTNPTLFFTFENGALIANTIWPETNKIKIDYTEFEVFTHCLLSRRGDRETTKIALKLLFSLNSERLNKLIELKLLLPDNIAKPFYGKLNLWVQHNWYLNSLFYFNTHNRIPAEKNTSFEKNNLGVSMEKLRLRKTCRNFSMNCIPKEALLSLIESLPTSFASNFNVYINIRNVENIEPGLYIVQNKELIKYCNVFSTDSVSSLIIGQEWAGKGALDIFLATNADITNGEITQTNIIELGRVGQRIIMTATEWCLGVFMTPAIKDSEFIGTINIDKYKENIFYYLGVGYENE